MAAVGTVGGNGFGSGPFYVAVDGEAVPESRECEDDVRDASRASVLETFIGGEKGKFVVRSTYKLNMSGIVA